MTTLISSEIIMAKPTMVKLEMFKLTIFNFKMAKLTNE